MKEEILKAIKEARKIKRNFVQTAELIVTIKDLDLNKTENRIEFLVTLPKGRGKEAKTVAIVDTDLLEDAKKFFDLVITPNDLEKYKSNKREARKFVRNYDFFVAQATIMPKLAAALGRYLGVKGKLPNPKLGTIIVNKQQLEIGKKLKNSIIIRMKKQPQIQIIVGNEKMKDEDLEENIEYVYKQIIHHLPKEEQNIKHLYFKFTMSKPIKIK